MAKDFITQRDLVPEWLKQVAAEDISKEAGTEYKSYKSEHHETTFQIPDLKASNKEVRPLVLFMDASKDQSDTEGSQNCQVGAFWKGDAQGRSLFSKQCKSSEEAQQIFDGMEVQLHKIDALQAVSPEIAAEQTEDFFKGVQSYTAPEEVSKTFDNHTMSSFVPGWDLVSFKNQLQIRFSDEFLKVALRKFKIATETPLGNPDSTYTTNAKGHCGKDNYVISSWAKANTFDGNILKNVVTITRVGNSTPSVMLERVFVNDFNQICSSLTPDATQYGLTYDSVTTAWTKTAGKSVIQNVFFESIEDLLEYQKSTKNVGQGAKTEALKGPKGEEAPESEEEKLEPTPSISFEDLMKEEGPSEGAALSEKEPQEVPATSSFKNRMEKVAAIPAEDLKEGQDVIYVSDEGEIKGKVVKNDHGVITLNDGKSDHTHLTEEEGISVFVTPGEHRGLKERETAHRKQENERKKVEGPDFDTREAPAEAPKSVDEIVEKTEEELEKEEAEAGKEEGQMADEDLGEATEKNQLAETSTMHPFIKALADSSIYVKAGLLSWLKDDWPKGLPTKEMQEIYNHMLVNFRNDLRKEIHIIHNNWKESRDKHDKLLALEGIVENAQGEIDHTKDEFEKGQLEKQQAKRKEEMEAIRKGMKRGSVSDDAYKASLIAKFKEFAHLSARTSTDDPFKDPVEIAKGSKELRKLLDEERQMQTELDGIRSRLTQMTMAVSAKEEVLLELFTGVPERSEQLEQAEAVSKRIMQVDDLFSRYLAQEGPVTTSQGIEKFQNLIQKLEKERESALKAVKLPETKQTKVDEAVQEIHLAQDELMQSKDWDVARDLEKKMQVLETEKNELMDSVGVVASLGVIAKLYPKKS